MKINFLKENILQKLTPVTLYFQGYFFNENYPPPPPTCTKTFFNTLFKGFVKKNDFWENIK